MIINKIIRQPSEIQLSIPPSLEPRPQNYAIAFTKPFLSDRVLVFPRQI